MIIGIDASRANEEQKTGVGWYAYHLIQNLKIIIPGHVRVILYTNKPLIGELADLPDNWEEKLLRWLPQRLWTQVRLSLTMLFHPPDILFIPAHVFPIIHPQKTIMTVHDIAAVKFPESYNRFERWYSLWSAKKALKKLWKVIVPSEFVRRELTTVYGQIYEYKISVIHHGVDKSFFKDLEPANENLLHCYGLQGPFIASIGRLEIKKNTIRLIHAFEKIKQQPKNQELQLLLMGLPGFGFEKVKEIIEQSKFKDDIIYPGWVEEKEMFSLLATAKVFVFPSLYEGFGLPVLEAFALGVPVVASGITAPTGLTTASQEVGGEACVCVDPLSIEEMSEAIGSLLLDDEFRREKIIQGFERVKKFSWEKTAQQTWELIARAH